MDEGMRRSLRVASIEDFNVDDALGVIESIDDVHNAEDTETANDATVHAWIDDACAGVGVCVGHYDNRNHAVAK